MKTTYLSLYRFALLLIGTLLLAGNAIGQYAVNVMDYGAHSTTEDGYSNFDSTDAFEAAIAAGKDVFVPAGVYRANIIIEGMCDKHIYGAGTGGAGTRIFPADTSYPVIDVVGTENGGAWAITIENMLLDSTANGSYSGVGIGLRLQGTSPGFVWRSAFRHLFIRGFQDGLVIDCDINTCEVFDNDFNDIETIGISRYSFKTRGVYNTFRKLFATQCDDYAIYNDGCNCTFDSIVGDGRMVWKGGGQHVTNAVIEAIHGAGQGAGYPAMEINGNSSTFRGVRLNGVPTAKYSIGFSIWGTQQTIQDMRIEGANYPATSIVFNSGSSGILLGGTAPAGATKASATTGWAFLGDVSTVYAGSAMPTAQYASFASYAATDVTGVTGAGVVATVPFDSEDWDDSANFTSNTFTAPIAGKYRFSAQVLIGGTLAGHTYGYLTLYTSTGQEKRLWVGSPAAIAASDTTALIGGSGTLSLSAGETVTVRIYITGGSQDVSIKGHSSKRYTHFSGDLIK